MGVLDDRTAIVTGAGHGIGRAYAERLARDGASVAIVDLDADAATALLPSFPVRGRAAIGIWCADVSNYDAMSGMAATVLDAFGRIDILVNNAAMFSRVPMARVPFEQIDEGEWDKMMAINLRGTWNPCRTARANDARQRLWQNHQYQLEYGLRPIADPHSLRNHQGWDYRFHAYLSSRTRREQHYRKLRRTGKHLERRGGRRRSIGISQRGRGTPGLGPCAEAGRSRRSGRIFRLAR